MSKIFDLVGSNGTYTDNQGQEKTRWIKCGAVFKSDQGNVSVKLEAVPTYRNENGELWLNCFVPQQQQQQGGDANFGRPAPGQGAPQGFRQRPAPQPAMAGAPPPAAPMQPQQGAGMHPSPSNPMPTPAPMPSSPQGPVPTTADGQQGFAPLTDDDIPF